MKEFYLKFKKKFFIFLGLYIVFLFSVPLISHAEGESASPSPSPSPVSVPSGYVSFGEYFGVTNNFIYTPDNITELPVGAIDPVEWNNGSFNFNYFDGDMSNGELCISSSLPSSRFYGYYLTDDGQLEDMHEYFLSDYFSHWFITYNPVAGSFQCSFTDMPIQEIDASSIGFQGFSKYPYATQDTILRYNILLYFEPMTGYQNCYSINGLPQQYYWSIPGEDYGEYNNLYADSWDYTLFTVNLSDIENIFATNFGNLYTNIPSERNGCDETRVYLNEQHTEIGSEIYGEPHYLFGHISNDDNVVYPDGSGGDDTNNMYMETADWKFNIPKYWGDMTSQSADPKYIANWGKGNIVFDGQINDYQIANASHFNLSFSFYIKMNGEYALGGIEDNGPVFRKFAGSYKLTEYTVPLQDFIDAGNLVGFNVKDIFDHALNNDGFAFTSFMQDMSIYSKYRSWDWTISCSAKLVSGNYVSGNLQETYNFITQISKENSNTITDNTNPFYPEDDNGDPDFNPNDPNSTTTTKKDGINITITNNPTFNNTNNNNNNNANNLTGGNDSFNPFEFLINKFIDQNEATTDNFFESTNLNPWFSIIQENFSFIPVSVWVVITAALTVMFSIIVIALIVSLVIKIIT